MARAPRFTGLWRHRDFMRLWTGQTISVVGSEITNFAFPIVAIIVLNASSRTLALLFTAFSVPAIAAQLVAGAWVDRSRRRRLLIWTNLATAALIASIPAAIWLDRLSFLQLAFVFALFGLLEPFFWTAFEAYVPTLVGRSNVVEANTKFETTQSVASIGGPGFAGVLVQALTAPLAMLLDAASFVVAALAVGRIRTAEPSPPPVEERPGLRTEIVEGLRVTLRDRTLLTIAGVPVILGLFGGMVWPNYYLYELRDLGFSPAVLGLVNGLGATGFLIGSLSAARLARRFGLGRAVVAAASLITVSPFFMPLARRGSVFAVPLMVAAAVLGATGDLILRVNLGSLRQRITPDRLLGRVVGSAEFLAMVTALIGPLGGGFLGDAIGRRPTLVVAACGHVFVLLWVLASPVRRVRDVPEAAEETDGPGGSALPSAPRPAMSPDEAGRPGS